MIIELAYNDIQESASLSHIRKVLQYALRGNKDDVEAAILNIINAAVPNKSISGYT
jgi:hypothetical protein